MVLLSVLLACSSSHRDTWGGETAAINVENYRSSECTANLTADTASGVPESIAATSDVAGTVHVAHTRISANCCGDHTPTPSADGSTIALRYNFSGGECDCMCTFDLDYDITGVAAGTYTVTYSDLSTSVTVE